MDHIDQTFFKGVVSRTTVLSDRVLDLEIVLANNSVPIKHIKYPPNVRRIVVWTTELESGIDQCDFPPNLRHLEIRGGNNSSLEKLRIPSRLKTLTVDENFRQPLDLVNFKVTCSTQPIELSRREKLVTTNSLYSTWFNEMFEGRSAVSNLVLEGPKSLRKADRVFYRSLLLERPVCTQLSVQNEILDEPVLFSLCSALAFVKNISIDITFVEHFPESLLPRLANILSGSKFLRNVSNMYITRSFGGTDSTVSSTMNVLKIVMGNLPRVFAPKIEASFEMVPVSTPKIHLYTWSNCSFCTRQEEIIKALTSDERDRFNRLVRVEKVDDPSKVSDKRVNSFPSWVIDDVVLPGVKNAISIKTLLEN